MTNRTEEFCVSTSCVRNNRAEFVEFLRNETTGGVILLVAAVVAIVWANSPIADSYETIRDFHIGPDLLSLNLSVGAWAKDGLLALFFFVAGLELKRELVTGELADRRAATLPVAAAVGGMIVPAVLAVTIGHGVEGMDQAWAIPVATDIAFALAILALTGSSLPGSARVFLLSMAVVDDLGAMILIAVLFTSGFDIVAAVVALAALGCYALLQHLRVRTPWIYVPLAVVSWVAVYTTGIHATITGVALGLLTRVRRDPGERAAPALRLEHRLQPWSASLAVPLFALFAAGIEIDGGSLATVFTTALPLSVFTGLLLGKFLGVLGACALTVRLGAARLPSGMGWRDLVGLALLAGIGFTVSLLITELALDEPLVEAGKTAVLLASLAASVAGAAVLFRRGRIHRRIDSESFHEWLG